MEPAGCESRKEDAAFARSSSVQPGIFSPSAHNQSPGSQRQGAPAAPNTSFSRPGLPKQPRILVHQGARWNGEFPSHPHCLPGKATRGVWSLAVSQHSLIPIFGSSMETLPSFRGVILRKVLRFTATAKAAYRRRTSEHTKIQVWILQQVNCKCKASVPSLQCSEGQHFTQPKRRPTKYSYIVCKKL